MRACHTKAKKNKPLIFISSLALCRQIQSKRNGSAGGRTLEGGELMEKKDKKASSARFTIYKVNKASKKKREKSSAKKERKATKTLAIVLGKDIMTPIYSCLMSTLTHLTLHL